jgi:crotonobetainyl-CoA:carnitine CoA-transferase CaiB-like acyl-CoA transferase
MSFAAQSYLLDGNLPPRVGNGHPNIVPYGAFQAQDGLIIVAIGTDAQFKRFCEFVGREDLLIHPHYLSNEVRVHHREEVMAEMNKIMGTRSKAYWLENLEKVGVPTGPVNTLGEAFEDPQVKASEIAKSFKDGPQTVASPLHLSASPPVYDRRPPHLGEHTEKILSEILSVDEIEGLKEKGVV